MGEKLLVESPVQVKKRLKKLGFTLDRTRGAHEQYMCKMKCHTVTIANHTRDIGKPVMSSIIRQSGCTKDEFYNGVKKCKQDK